ncbi:MAG: CPBP family intramembrane metalloprotease [Deltaproteobacteria bacterium]|nr:CPBP family intramembrane metalloprotease [Deltaproteobacteria bacterium]
MSSSDAPTPAPLSLFAAFKTNAWTDLALTMPIFVGYHLGVVTLNVRNAADFFTQKLIAMAERNILVYWGLTLAIGAALFVGMWLLGAGAAFDKKRFVLVAIEGVLYAMLMRTAAIAAVGALPMANVDAVGGPVPGLVMSLGAGFYEEVAFRVVLFGGGMLAMSLFFGGISKLVLALGWGLVCAAVFSGWHYVGPLGDAWNLQSFVFRMVCGLVFTLIFVLRGFAPAVWTHALYDIWVMVLH